MMTRSLSSRRHPLSATAEQVRTLRETALPDFESRLAEAGLPPLKAVAPGILQVNIGYMCNQTCRHCHVDAGPDRKEKMSRQVMEQVLDWLRTGLFHTLDITGGAPEMHNDFRWLVEQAAKTAVKEIIVRSNLTIIVSNPAYHDLPDFFRRHRVRVCSSLPFHQADRTDRQRGEGVFSKSIQALKMLNETGYGMPDSDLMLDLVYNPSGAFLPGNQSELEQEFKKSLLENHGIRFNRLFTITNVPVSRFLDFLLTSGNYELYMRKLVDGFNPSAVNGLMCRDTVSVDWQGNLYDCDFNQMLELKMLIESSHISSIKPQELVGRKIATCRHCFACTAGSGSSCQGALA